MIKMRRAAGAFAILLFACAKAPDIVVVSPNGAINVPQPVKIESITAAHDGGTLAFIIRGRDAKDIPVCFDGRMSIPLEDRHFYIGADYPTKRGASAIKDGSETQAAVLKIVDSWLGNHTAPDKRGNGMRHLEDMTREDIEYLEIQSVAKHLRDRLTH